MTTSPQGDLTGQTAVVTGASSGIGRAIALAFATAGADCLVHARSNHAGAEATAAEIRGLGRQAVTQLADLADPQAHEKLVDAAWQWQGAVDIWVNNAGVDVLTGELAQRSFEEKLSLLLAVDVTATVRLSRLVGKRMQERGHGVILNMGWDQAERGMAGDSGEMFSAVKGAVMTFSRSLARSLAPQVRVNCLAPGWIRTAWGETTSAAWKQRAMKESLLERWGTPEDVAEAACYLASPRASFITGETLSVSGGHRDV